MLRGALCLALLAVGCSSAAVHPLAGGVAVDAEDALSFQRRADGFYRRLAHRRFNTLETYDDFILRDHFRSPDLFFDYYADLADQLSSAHFEMSRPTDIDVQGFRFLDAQAVDVVVSFEGRDGRPLRPGGTRMTRIDRWEWRDGTWWLRPGKL